MALVAPRSLNDPIGCRFSSLTWISAGAPSTARRTRGVRSTSPARRSRAARTSARVGASTGGIAASSQLDPGPHPRRPRAGVAVMGGGDVLDGEAEGLEHRDLRFRAPPAHLPDVHLAALALHF